MPKELRPSELLDVEHDARVRATAQEHTGDAIDTIKDIMADELAGSSTRLAAAKSMVRMGQEDDRSKDMSIARAIADAAIIVNQIRFGEEGDRVEHFTMPPVQVPVVVDDAVDVEFEEVEQAARREPEPASAAAYKPGEDPLAFEIDEPGGDWTK